MNFLIDVGVSVDSILLFLGGIALFLYGIDLMSDSLKKAAGSKLKTIIEKTTGTPLKGILVGTLVTALTQSSTGVTVLTIGLVRAGLMTTPQSVGIIMGANIGTTITAFIISLPIEELSMIILFIGVVMLFVKNRKVRNIGGILAGLGMLFFGLETMGNGLKPIASTDFAIDMFQAFSKESFGGIVLGTVFGTIFTAVVQSSSAAIGILQKLYALNDPSNDFYTISLRGALPILLGSNIGTTLSAWVASWGGNTDSKRTAIIHINFNIIGSIIFIIFIGPYDWIVQWTEDKFLTPYSMASIAYAHAVQNVLSTAILYFFIKQQIKLANFMVKAKDERKLPELVFDEKLISESPTMALDVVRKGISYMGEIVKEYYEMVKVYTFENNPKVPEEANMLEIMIDNYDKKLHDYLIKISQTGLSNRDSKRLSRNLDTIKDFERIGDHLTNIVEYFELRYEAKQLLSDAGALDLKALYSVIDSMLSRALECLLTKDKNLANEIIEFEKIVDKMEVDARYRYIDRLKQGEVPFVMSANFTDVLSDIERIADHLMNIALSVIEPLHLPQSVSTGLKKHIEN